MCGKKPPKPEKPQPNYELIRETEAQRQVDSTQRAELKRMRLEDRIGRYGNRFGRASLFTGGQGGIGYAAPVARQMFTQA